MRYRYNRRRPSTGGSKLAYPVVAFLFVFAVIVQAASVIIPALCLIGCAVGIYYLANHFSQMKAEKEELYKILQIPEPKPVSRQAKKPGDHASAEEIRLYEALNRFLPQYDVYLCAVDKLYWMRKRCEAQRKLEMEADFSQEQFQEQEKIVRLEEKRCCKNCLDSPEAFYPQRPGNLFDDLSKHLVSVEDPLISHFFTGIPIYTVRGSHAEKVCFTPWYLLFFDSKNLSFTIEDYESLSFETETSTVKKTGSFNKDDEIAYQVWEHERKDGGPDLRYRENSCTTYLYRGKASFSCKSYQWSIDFPNKSSMEKLGKSLRNFLAAKPLPVLKKESEKQNSEPEKHTARLLPVQTEKKSPEKPQTCTNFVKAEEKLTEIPEVGKEKLSSAKEIMEEVADSRVSLPTVPVLKPSQRIYTAQELADEYQKLLSPGVILRHRTLGAGVLTRIEKSKGYMYVRFGSEEKRFLYPKALQQGYFTMIEPLQEETESV